MLNRARIEELREEVGEDGFDEVVDLFCEEVEEVLDELQTLAAAELPGRLHFLKGSALNIGMDEVGELCLAEEHRLRADAGASPDIAAIRAAFDTARQALATLA